MSEQPGRSYQRQRPLNKITVPWLAQFGPLASGSFLNDGLVGGPKHPHFPYTLPTATVYKSIQQNGL